MTVLEGVFVGTLTFLVLLKPAAAFWDSWLRRRAARRRARPLRRLN